MRYNFGTPIETNQLQFAKRTQGSNDEGGASKIEINVSGGWSATNVAKGINAQYCKGGIKAKGNK